MFKSRPKILRKCQRLPCPLPLHILPSKGTIRPRTPGRLPMHRPDRGQSPKGSLCHPFDRLSQIYYPSGQTLETAPQAMPLRPPASQGRLRHQNTFTLPIRENGGDYPSKRSERARFPGSTQVLPGRCHDRAAVRRRDFYRDRPPRIGAQAPGRAPIPPPWVGLRPSTRQPYSSRQRPLSTGQPCRVYHLWPSSERLHLQQPQHAGIRGRSTPAGLG